MDRAIELLDSAVKEYSTKKAASQIYPHLKLSSAVSRLAKELTETETAKLGIRTIIQIMQITGDLSALDRIEDLFNRVAFVLPSAEQAQTCELMCMMADLTKEFAEHAKAVSEALRDERISKKEAKVCLKEIEDVIKVSVKIKAYLESLL